MEKRKLGYKGVAGFNKEKGEDFGDFSLAIWVKENAKREWFLWREKRRCQKGVGEV